jgi:hypothetical protein
VPRFDFIVHEGQPRISLLCPTRGRPAGMRRLVESADRTAAGTVEVVFYLDEDDAASIATARELAAARGGGIVALIGPRILLSATWNACAEQATAEVLMHCGDDIVFRSPRWDDLVLAAFAAVPDRILFAHGDDGIWCDRLGTHGFLHRAWVDTVGYFVPPYFSSDYNDTWLTEVADALGRRRYLPDVVTEHLHPVVGKAGWDLTHRERLLRGERDNVAGRYAELAPQRALDAALLRAAMHPQPVAA